MPGDATGPATPPAGQVLDVHVGIFGQNEGTRLEACLRSVSAALGSKSALMTLILNGSTDDSERIARTIAPSLGHPLRVCVIPHADKANAINCFFYDLREPARLYLCVDAYATINPGAVDAIVQRFKECPEANVVTGVAGNGRNEPKSNEQTVEQGGIIHGQLYAPRPRFLDRLTAMGVRLPVGLYRGDGFIGYLACHDLDAVGQAWDNKRLVGAAGAQFMIEQLSPLRLRDIKRQFRRKVRQMRGRIENAAIGHIASKDGFAALPADADDMIRDHLRRNPVPRVPLPDRPFMALAVRHNRQAVAPDPARLKPACTPA